MEIARSWRMQAARLRLEGSRCDGCGAVAFPAREAPCGSCGGDRRSPHRFSGRGEVWSFAEVNQAPAGFDAQAPYLVALVRLAEGPMVTAMLADVDADDVRIGMAVEMVTRRIREDGPDGVIVYGYKFRPPIRGVEP